MDSSTAGLGTLLVVLGGVLQGSFALPMKRMKLWQWENTWLVYSVTGLIVFPLALALATVPSPGSVYAQAAGATLAAVALGGLGWGIGSTLFGLGISRVGIGLGFAIILGITSSVGSLLPLIILSPADLWTRRGLMLMIGLALVIGGIIALSAAGALRERDQAATAKTAARSGFGTGLAICIASGFLSPALNFGFVFGKPLQDAAKALGAGAMAANIIWVPALAAGFIPNAGYSIYLLAKNKTWPLYSQHAISGYWIGATIMGLFWFGGISIYGLGAAAMGPLGGVIGWPVFMDTIILVANVAGYLTGEWKGAGTRARAFSWVGMAILIAAIYVISLGA
jgi:L-rhamnose-H+ transport protein